MTTPVGKVTGIGPKTAAYLQDKGIESVEALLQAGVSVLIEAPGFGESRANTVMDAAKKLTGEVSTLSQAEAGDSPERKKKKAGDKKKKAGKGKKGDKSGKKAEKDSGKKKKKGKKDKKKKKK